jgi:uncharacterized protein (DUF305 family)
MWLPSSEGRTMVNKMLFAVPLLMLAVMAPLAAQHQGHSGHGASPAPAASASTRAYQAVNAKMHKDMDIRFSGDADIDFVKGMIPHHVAAVEMAKVVLQHGKDPELKKLANEIVAAQDKEITVMREWLKKRGH